MILIVDSGSTKCDWIAVDSKGNQLFEKVRTKGMNPAILSQKKLLKILRKSDLSEINDQAQYVFFYGAGCGTERPRILLKTVLQEFFVNAQVEVNEDTLAAVYGTISHKDEAAVVCILGTGSNCSYFDGHTLYQRVKSLGYSIMDDAAGNYFGRQMIRDYYYNRMPENLKISLATKYNMDSDFIKYHLYKQPNPNAYLASFAEFMFLNKDSEYIKELILSGIRLFTENMIMQYRDVLVSVPVHFAGSIAYFSSEEIHQIASEFNFKIGNIVRRPIDGLVKYHIKNLEAVSKGR